MSEEEGSVKSASVMIVMMAISQSLGPIPGSILAGNLGVPWANTVLAVIALTVYAILLISFESMESARPKVMM